ncbi:OmpA family protein [Alkanindiges sp. WGS2144]|uniref:OmpA family protein n=1 Tax=Alkanindiges sp. WGS2144 TaxID=3366808 RepID=UPI003752ADCB
MALNPIDLLKEQVTPQLLSHSEADFDSKSALLDQFYPVLVAIFSHQPNAFNYALEHNEATLSDILPVQAANASYQQLLEEFSRHHNLPISTITPLFDRAVPISAQALNNDIGPEDTIAYLQRYLPVIRSSIPAWAVAILSTLGLATLFNTQTAPPAPDVLTAEPVKHMPAADAPANRLGRFMPWLVLLILLLLLLLFWRACQHKEALPPAPETSPAATTQAATAFIPATLSVSSGVNGSLQACNAYVGAATLESAINSAVTSTFGSSPDCRMSVDQAYAPNLPGQDKLTHILGSLHAFPHASLQWTGNQITINALDSGDLNRLVEQIRTIAPELSVIAAPPLDINASVNSSIDAAQSALNNLRSPVRPADVARALNLQIINFASDSAVIPEQNKTVLNQAAAIIRQTPNVALTVEGYTDATGNAAHNRVLSEKRAQSVVSYLVDQGVSPDKLRAVGYGQANPVADNMTELGKFRNRRIEFKVINTSTGNTQHIDEDTVYRTAQPVQGNEQAIYRQEMANRQRNASNQDVINDQDTTVIATGSGSAPENP